jgi:hypothetical protein
MYTLYVLYFYANTLSKHRGADTRTHIGRLQADEQNWDTVRPKCARKYLEWKHQQAEQSPTQSLPADSFYVDTLGFDGTSIPTCLRQPLIYLKLMYHVKNSWEPHSIKPLTL